MERFYTMPPGEWENDLSPQPLLREWWAVVDDTKGIVAYAYHEDLAEKICETLRSQTDVSTTD